MDKLGELPQHVGAEHQVHVAEGLFDLVGHVLLLGHAAAHADDLVRVAALHVDQGARLPSTRCSACSRMAQVFRTMIWASSSWSVKP